MSLGKIAMTKEALWTWIRSKVNNHESRITDLESGGGPPPGSSVTMAGDVTGNSAFSTVAAINGFGVGSSPSKSGDVLMYDLDNSVLVYGRPAFNNIQVLTDSGDINSDTQLVVVDVDNSPGGTLNIVLPTITPLTQLIFVKILGISSVALVSLDTLASNGFDPITGQATVSSLQNLGRGTIIVVAPDYTNNCWWNLGVTYI